MAPWWSHKVSQPLKGWMAERAIVHVWYVDAILLLGRCEAEVAHQTAVVVDPMTEMGAQVNFDKSTKTPSQPVVYLGQRLDLLNDRILTEIVLPHRCNPPILSLAINVEGRHRDGLISECEYCDAVQPHHRFPGSWGYSSGLDQSRTSTDTNPDN